MKSLPDQSYYRNKAQFICLAPKLIKLLNRLPPP